MWLFYTTFESQVFRRNCKQALHLISSAQIPFHQEYIRKLGAGEPLDSKDRAMNIGNQRRGA